MANHLDLEEQEQLDQLKHFWNTWGTLISSVLILIAGSLAAWNGYQYWQNRQAIYAAALFDAVESAAITGDVARMGQAFSDIQAGYADTAQAGQAGLTFAKSLLDKNNPDGAVDVLKWVADKSSDEGFKALAKLRLSGVLMDQKSYDEALKLVLSSFPREFEAVYADRRGDILVLQGKNAEAISEYTRAYKAFDEGVEYRRLVEIKLNALGFSPESVAVATGDTAGGGK